MMYSLPPITTDPLKLFDPLYEVFGTITVKGILGNNRPFRFTSRQIRRVGRGRGQNRGKIGVNNRDSNGIPFILVYQQTIILVN